MPVLDTRRASVGLFLLAGSVLVLEVALTRVFSVMAWHHFAYVIISLGMLGFGAASTFLTVSKRFAGDGVDARLVCKYALAFCITTMLAFAVATKVRFHPSEMYDYGDFSNTFSLAMLYAIVGVPFFFAGVCIGYLISRAGEAINRLYFADLLGAGAGALVSIVGVNRLGVESTIYAAAAAAGIVAVAYARAATGRWLRVGSVAALAMAVLMTVLASRATIFPVYFPPSKVPREPAMTPHYYRWHVVARVDVMNHRKGLWDFDGQFSPKHQQLLRQIEHRGVLQDGAAPTVIVRVPDGDLSKVPALGLFLQAAPYIVRPSPDQALVIGVGGGLDVGIALFHGAKRIVGVEINPVTVEAVSRRFADFGGRIFDRPEVDLVAAEGRHYLTTSDARFDVIQLTGVDTFTAQSMGAYALSENYLYTVEAVEEYWRHLNDDGILSFSRWMRTPPREQLRLVTILLEAMGRIGIEHPENHLIVIAATFGRKSWAETLVKRTPFTRAEVARSLEWADRLGFATIYDPFRGRDNAFNHLIRASDAERQALIDDYFYDITPTTDDDPFFFQFHRWRTLLGRSKDAAGQSGYGQLPMAMRTLLTSLVQILVLSAVFIIGPLWSRSGQLRQVEHKGRVLLYFAALGLGFITVEIVMLQRYTVFVGGPVYAMAVTLFAILVFSGLGSLISGWVRRTVPHSLTFVLLALAAAIIAEAMVATYVVPRLMFLSHTARCVVTVAALAPMAMLMGMPFPMGLRAARGLGQTIVPWAWGVNAVATTLGAILCVLASMEWGFTASLVAAAVLYLMAMSLGLEDVVHKARAPATTEAAGPP